MACMKKGRYPARSLAEAIAGGLSRESMRPPSNLP
jgi:hypothetical protein